MDGLRDVGIVGLGPHADDDDVVVRSPREYSADGVAAAPRPATWTMPRMTRRRRGCDVDRRTPQVPLVAIAKRMRSDPFAPLPASKSGAREPAAGGLFSKATLKDAAAKRRAAKQRRAAARAAAAAAEAADDALVELEEEMARAEAAAAAVDGGLRDGGAAPAEAAGDALLADDPDALAAEDDELLVEDVTGLE